MSQCTVSYQPVPHPLQPILQSTHRGTVTKVQGHTNLHRLRCASTHLQDHSETYADLSLAVAEMLTGRCSRPAGPVSGRCRAGVGSAGHPHRRGAHSLRTGARGGPTAPRRCLGWGHHPPTGAAHPRLGSRQPLPPCLPAQAVRAVQPGHGGSGGTWLLAGGEQCAVPQPFAILWVMCSLHLWCTT